MNSNLKLLPAALLVAMLALAGCGGSNDTTSSNDDMDDQDQMPVDPSPTALETASDELTKALAAKAAADDLLEKAVAASKKLGTKAVDGSSMMASSNAMLVLMAEADIMAEYEKAKAAHTAAQAAHTAAPAEQKARIALMVMDAMDARDAIKAILDAKDVAGTADGSLAEAIARVKTGAKTTDTDAMIAQAKAKAVADAIATAITAQIPATTPETVTLDVTPSSSGAPAGAVMKAGLAGMTFAEIAGGNVKLATSIKDFKSGSDPATSTAFSLTAPATLAADTDVPATYMGIPGNLKCLVGETCSYDSTGKITGAVNFTPNSQTNLWAQATYGGDYTVVTNAATYGHWLNTAGTAVVLHASSSSTSLNWQRAATSNTVTTATYAGKAGGYSEKTTGTGAAATRASGTFTADVKLSASFGAADADARLGGSISNFMGGDHVDTDWYVTLQEQTDASDGFATGVVDTSMNQAGREDAISGGWHAYGYGEATKNPSGFVGIFSAGFDNGSAAGSYQATKSAN